MIAARPTPRPRRFALAALVAALGAALAAGCTEKLVQPPPPEPVYGVPDSVQAVFTANCGFAGCHGGATPQQGMDLSSARSSWLAIVGVPSNERSQFMRIAPGDSANSYVVMKLRNDPRKGGQPMPLGDYPLEASLTLTVASWAAQGAPGQVQPVALAAELR